MNQTIIFNTSLDSGNSILKYEWITRSLKHARVFGHDGVAGVLEIEQVF
jgi:hypothetical protein